MGAALWLIVYLAVGGVLAEMAIIMGGDEQMDGQHYWFLWVGWPVVVLLYLLRRR